MRHPYFVHSHIEIIAAQATNTTRHNVSRVENVRRRQRLGNLKLILVVFLFNC